MTGLHHYSWGRYPGVRPVGILFYLLRGRRGRRVLCPFLSRVPEHTHPRYRARNRGFLIAALIGFPAYIDFLPKLGLAVYPVGYLAVAAYALLRIPHHPEVPAGRHHP